MARVQETVVPSRLHPASAARKFVRPERATRVVHSSVSLPVRTPIVHLVPMQENTNSSPKNLMLAL